MALFPNTESEYKFGGKSHTNLVISEGVAPAEKWVVAKDNEATPFIYEFGPEGNQTVELAKGKVVELGAPEYDHDTGRMVSTIKQATEGSKNAVGVLHHNVYEQRRGRFSGNNQPNPVVITRSHIEVPLFEHTDVETAEGFASAMKFGAAYGTSNELTPGDFVKVGKNGNFVRLDTEADSPFEVIGQVLAVERELPPAGFLQYYMGMEINELEAFMKAQSHAPSPGSNGRDAGAYPMGYPYKAGSWKSDFAKLLNPTHSKGIPFLTDGYFRAKQVVTGINLEDIYDKDTNNDGHVEAVQTTGDLTVTGSNVVVAEDSHSNAIFVKFRHEIDKAEKNPVKVEDVAQKDIHVDYVNNTAVIYLEAGQELDVNITASLVVDPVAGIPTEWDHAGSVGAVRILLQR